MKSLFLVLITFLFLISCETSTYQVTNTSANGSGVIEWSDGQYLSGNFISTDFCQDCTFRSSRNIQFKGDFRVDAQNSWNYIAGNTYSATFNDDGGYYVVEYVKPYGTGIVQNPVRVSHKNQTYEINISDFTDVAYLVSISSPIGLSYEEALKECKTLGYKDASDALMDCVLELSQ